MPRGHDVKQAPKSESRIKCAASIMNRTDEIYRPIVARTIALYDGSRSAEAIAEIYTAEGVPKQQPGPWTRGLVRDIARGALGEDEYARRVAMLRSKNASKRKAVGAAKARRAALGPKVAALWEEMSEAAIAERMEADGEPTFSGNPWQSYTVMRILQDHYGGEEYRRKAWLFIRRRVATLVKNMDAFYEAAARRIDELYDGERGWKVIARQLKAEGFKTRFGPWRHTLMKGLLVKRIGAEAYRARAVVMARRGAVGRAAEAAAFYQRFGAKFRQLRAEGLSHPAIAARWNEAEDWAFGDRPWTRVQVTQISQRYGWTCKKGGPAVVLQGPDMPILVHGRPGPKLSPKQYRIFEVIRDDSTRIKLTRIALRALSSLGDADGVLERLIKSNPILEPAIGWPEGESGIRFLPAPKAAQRRGKSINE